MAERISYAEKFNKILVQIDELAQASGCPAPKIFDEHCAMTTATFPNAIVPLIINTTAFLLIAVTKGSRKTVMPAVTGCTLPAVTAHVRETPPSLIPKGAETQPPTTAATPVIIPISPAAIRLRMKPDAHAGLIPVLTAAAAPAHVVLLVRLPLLPAQAARLQGLLHRGAAVFPVEVHLVQDRLLLAEVIKLKNLPAKIVLERLTIPARTNQPAPTLAPHYETAAVRYLLMAMENATV